MASSEFSSETIEAFRDIFRRKDKDGSGTLNSAELEECLQLCGLIPTKKDLQFLKKHFDTNGDGKLQIEELLSNMHMLHEHGIRREQLMAAFQLFDTNGDGFIRLPELLQILTANDFMSPAEAQKFLRRLTDEFDADKDGKFNYTEFIQIYNNINTIADRFKS